MLEKKTTEDTILTAVIVKKTKQNKNREGEGAALFNDFTLNPTSAWRWNTAAGIAVAVPELH